MSTFTIMMNGLRFHSRIGVAEQERIVGNDFLVDVSMTVSSDGFVSEDIATTISYADAYETVSRVMQHEWLLLESAGRQCADELRRRWPAIQSCKFKITKLSVPISGIDGTCAVEYTD